MPLPFESVSGVTPSLWKSVNVVPAGNVPAPTVMSNTSVPLPVLVSVLVNATSAPCGAEATVWPVNVSDTVWFTVNGARLVVNGPDVAGAVVVGVARRVVDHLRRQAGVHVDLERQRSGGARRHLRDGRGDGAGVDTPKS